MRLFLTTFLIVSVFSLKGWSVELYVASSFEKVAKATNPVGRTYADASSRLATQILAGATPDVFVSANRYWVEAVQKSNPNYMINHLADNALVVAVLKPTHFPTSTIGDICNLSFAAALNEVPAGTYADQGMEKLGCKSEIVRAPNVGAVREWIKSGHVDAGFIYASDLVQDQSLISIHRFEPSEIAVSLYAIALTGKGKIWIDKISSSPMISDFGFLPPIARNRPTPLPSLQDEEINASSILWNSALVGVLVVLLAFGPAVFLGFLLARWRSPWKFVVSIITMAPLVVPPVVTGLVLLKVFGKYSVLSPVLDVFGSPAFTWVGAVLASLLVSFPLFLVMTRRAFESVDRSFEVVGLSCGKTRWQVFKRITLPLAMPGIIAGAMLTFARSLGEFGATAVFAGNLAAEGGTISLAIYRSLQSPTGVNLIWILTLFSILLSLVAIGVYEYFLAKQKALFSKGN